MEPTPTTPPPTTPPRRRRRAVVAAAVVLALGAAATSVAVASGGDEEPGCAPGTRPLHVLAAPEVAGLVADLAALADEPPCAAPVVTSGDPAEVAAALGRGQGAVPDVWVPDSSLWADRPGLPPGLPRRGESLARSPLVVAVPAEAARARDWPARPLGVRDLLPAEVAGAAAGPGDVEPVPFSLPAPAGSAASTAAVLALRSALAGPDAGTAQAVALATLLRAGAGAPAAAPADLLDAPQDVPRAVPVPEQAVYAHNTRLDGTRWVAAYAEEPRLVLDYPMLVLTADPAGQERAGALLVASREEEGRRLVHDAGFRTPDGAAGPELSSVTGADGRRPGDGSPVHGLALDAADRTLTTVTRPTRLLAVLDVSGSMAQPAPGAGGASRLQVALGAAVAGLALYPDETEVGLWVFSADLEPGVDHREVVPVVRLGRGPDGSLGRDRLTQGLGQVAVVPYGRTGLYDTALAAVRQARRDWDPQRANAVVLLTDGRDEDTAGISLPELLATLEAEADPARPVPLYTVGYGPESDRAALTGMSAATGGVSYAADTPEEVRTVLLDAIARRPAAGRG